MNILTRYVLASSIVILLAMTLVAYVITGVMQKMYLDETVKDASIISETIIRTTHHRMLENDFNSVYQMIQQAGLQKGVKQVRLVNKDGRITFSTKADEIGQVVDKNAAACAVCHTENVLLFEASSLNRSRRFVNASGEEFLGLATGIYNEPVCSTAACHVHTPDVILLGVLDVILPLKEMRTQAILFRDNVIFLTALMLFVLLILLVLITHIYVKVPIRQLVEHTHEVSRGNLDARLGILPSGALRDLGKEFNDMTRSLQQAQSELRFWASTLEERVEERTRENRAIQAQLVHSERLASIGELSAGIAHEINNPLTGVMLFSSMLLDNPRLDPMLKPDLETILDETRRCADIVRRLLEFSRESAPKMRDESLHVILEGTLVLVERQALYHNVRIIRDYAAELPEVLVDRDQIRQVFMNILLNAGQAMESGGVLEIGTKSDPETGFLHISFSDNGCGISENHLSRIFDPFFSTKGTQGTGLGLSVSFGIIRNHGGRIEVSSQVGKGTTFVIFLPTAPQSETLWPETSAGAGTSFAPR